MFRNVILLAWLAAATAACTQPDAPPHEPNGASSPAGSPSAAVTRSAMSFRDFSARHRDLVGKEITVRGRVLFKFTCPPPGSGTAPPCTASAYLTDPAVRELGDDTDAVALIKNGGGMGCQAHTTANLTCAGLRHDTTYLVTGTVTRAAINVIDIGEG